MNWDWGMFWIGFACGLTSTAVFAVGLFVWWLTGLVRR